MTEPSKTVSFTIPGRVMGKIRWGSKPKTWGSSPEAKRARRYIDQCRTIRAIAWDGRSDTAPLPPYMLGVAVFLNPAKSGPNKGTFGGGGSDYDNIRGAILDALQGCLLCEKKEKGKGKCQCANPRILLLEDSVAWYRGTCEAAEHPYRRWQSRCYLTNDGEPERVCVTFEPDVLAMGREARNMLVAQTRGRG